MLIVRMPLRASKDTQADTWNYKKSNFQLPSGPCGHHPRKQARDGRADSLKGGVGWGECGETHQASTILHGTGGVPE